MLYTDLLVDHKLRIFIQIFLEQIGEAKSTDNILAFMANILSALALERGHGNGKRASKGSSFGKGFALFKDFFINSVFFVALVGFSISSSTALRKLLFIKLNDNRYSLY